MSTFNVPQFSGTPSRILRIKPDYECYQELTPHQLQAKTDELELRLGAVECENDGLQDKIRLLEKEKQKLLSEVKAGVEGMAEQQREYDDIYIQYKKSTKALEGLNAYLETLPLPEELTQLKAQVGEQKETISLLQSKCDVLQSDLTDERKNNGIYSDQLLQCNHQLDDYKRRLEQLRTELTSIQERKAQVESMGDVQVDDVLWERDRLLVEKKNTSKLLSSFKKKVKSLEEKLETLTADMESKLREQSRELRATRGELEKEREANQEHQRHIEQVGLELSASRADVATMHSEQQVDMELWGVRNALYSEFAAAVMDLRKVVKVCHTLQDGTDPSSELLLGPCEVVDTVVSHKDMSQLRSHLQEVRSLRGEIHSVHSLCVDQYADKLSDNLVGASCIQQ